MRPLHPLLETRLREVSLRWKSHRVQASLFTFWTVCGLVALALGLAVQREWLQSGTAALVIALLLVLVGGAAFLVVVLVAGLSRLPRAAQAQALEDVRPDLLDRVHTLVYLEGQKAGTPASYTRRIEMQAAQEVAGRAIPTPFPLRLRRRRLLACLLSLFAALAFWTTARPWTHLRFDEPDAVAAGTAFGADAAELEPKVPGGTAEPPWGEVRITEPGRDLKVTKVDVVPLQIEAAASETLSQAQWLTAVGGGPRAEHRLPAPAEPHYAVYKPLLYLDELRLSDWDVLSYHASASTQPGRSYASEIYFIEVRPFREDILKLPGGEGGKAYALLNELSGLIDRQKHVFRETHGAATRPRAGEAAAQDRKKLAEEEQDLAQAARHLYGKIAALEHADVAVVLDNLARAEELLAQSSGTVKSDPSRALPQEQEALTALVATRKRLQKAISDDPSAFQDGSERDEDRSPVAELPDKLKKIAEFRDEQKAVREALRHAVAEQRRIAEEAKKGEPPTSAAGAPPGAGELAREEKRLQAEVQDLAQQHPRHFARAKEQTRKATEAMEAASRALSEGKNGAEATNTAHDAVKSLSDAVAERGGAEQLGQAYALRDELQKQARAMGKMAEAEHADAGSAKATAEAARSTTRALQSLVEDSEVGQVLEGPLKEALSPGQQRAREATLDALAKAEAEGTRRQAADRARRSLEGLTDAFDRSAPDVVRNLRKEDALQDKGTEAFARGLRELAGLTGERAPQNADDSRKQGRDAVVHLERGAKDAYKNDPRMARLLLEVKAAVDGPAIDAPRLRKLLEEIERFRVEMGDARVARPDRPDLRHTDAARLPAAYRDRIERYFEMLSEE